MISTHSYRPEYCRSAIPGWIVGYGVTELVATAVEVAVAVAVAGAVRVAVGVHVGVPVDVGADVAVGVLTGRSLFLRTSGRYTGHMMPKAGTGGDVAALYAAPSPAEMASPWSTSSRVTVASAEAADETRNSARTSILVMFRNARLLGHE